MLCCLPGTKKKICAGELPLTPEDHEKLVRKEVKDQWGIYVAVGVIVTAIVTAIATAIVMKMCCMNGSGEVSPRD